MNILNSTIILKKIQRSWETDRVFPLYIESSYIASAILASKLYYRNASSDSLETISSVYSRTGIVNIGTIVTSYPYYIRASIRRLR